jgi:hypothetical protein
VTDLELLQEFHREKLASLLRHQAGARLIRQYDANNTYQYIINREDTQLSWVGRALDELGAAVQAQPARAEPSPRHASKDPNEGQRIFEEDAREAAAFVDRWRPRVETVQDARHRGTLRVILGETLEHKRFFEQALAGDTELLGKRTDHVGARVGEVLPDRWIG